MKSLFLAITALILLFPLAASCQSLETFAQLSEHDILLLNQNGRQVRLYHDLIKGKVVAINSVFTSCTTICPVLGTNFASLTKKLGTHAGKDALLISISIDPETDTPVRLKSWSEKFHGGPGWVLLTGSKSDVDAALKTLGIFTPDRFSHTPVVLIANDNTKEIKRLSGLASCDKLATTMIHMVEGLPSDSTEKAIAAK